jgi:hypothetical protein
LGWDFIATDKRQITLTETDPGATKDGKNEEDDGVDDEFTFRLFRTDKPAAKVVLPDDKPLDTTNAGFVVPQRPLSHYVATQPTAEQQSQFEMSALTGDDIISMSKRRWWGMEMPWRVKTVTVLVDRMRGTVTRTERGQDPAHKIRADGSLLKGRKRPGKKKRIKTRIMIKADKAKEAAEKVRLAAEEQQKAEKEAHLVDKKKRLNKLRKMRRKAIELEKKQSVALNAS